jgi:hypothetical protein
VRSAQAQFEENVRRVRSLGGIADAVESLTTTVLDISDLWRAQIVLAVSALDHFVHELVRLGMIDCAKGEREKTDAYRRFVLPVSATESALAGSDVEVWIGEAVRQHHSWQSFQDPEKLANAIRLISSVKLWDTVGKSLNLSASDVKTRLALVVDRRNKIAHEADLDPSNPSFRWPIDARTSAETVKFIEELGLAIFHAVKNTQHIA